jgi:hypothetical protein
VTTLDLLNADFRDMVQALLTERADFLIVGGFAVAVHGHPRTTGDMDLWVRPTPENASRVWRALARFGAPLAALGIVENDFSRPDMVVQFGVPPRRIDVLTSISDVDFATAWQHRFPVDWNGQTVPFLGFEQLLRNKRAAGRPKDLADAAELERQRKARP